jgi:hypothetical protein
MALTRRCPNCSQQTISVSSLVMADVDCANCKQLIGVHWLFRFLFFIIIFPAAALTGLVVYVDQGLYAALLFVSLPIGAIGYIKARFSPLAVRRQRSMPRRSTERVSSSFTHD